MKLKCDLIIQNLNVNNPSSLASSSTNQFQNQEKLHKSATIGLYRPRIEDEDDWSSTATDKKTIILTIETKTINLKYKLKRIETNTKFVNDGKASLKLVDENVYLLISNTPSLTLINFISFLRIKMSKSIKIAEAAAPQKPLLKNENKFVNKLLKNVQCNIPQSGLAGISPLCEKEVNDALNSKQNKNNSNNDGSPINCRVKKPLRNITNQRLTSSQPVKPSPNRSCTNKLPRCASSSSNLLVQLTDEQKYVLKAIKDGHNVFFTGSGGVGKSFLINLIRKSLPSDTCFVTASTGVAASLIGGITLHAFAGIGTATSNTAYKTKNSSSEEKEADQEEEREEEEQDETYLKSVLEKVLKSKDKVNNWKKCKHLIIDEISMVDGDFFDTTEWLARQVKKNDLPFGGIQLILCGDFFQLPPVSRFGERRKKFCFQSNAWNKCIEVNMLLSKVKRQVDSEFIQMLEEIRYGKCSKKTVQLLENNKNKTFSDKGILPTKLCTHKDDVEFINKKELESIAHKSNVYKAIDDGDAFNNTKLLNILCPAKQELELKLNAQVMLIKNLDVGNNLVNGSRGCVVGFTEHKLPIVRFLNGNEITIKYDSWSYNLNAFGQTLVRKQIPLLTAWAISIHKSQGVTLDCVEISLSRVFEYGQAYVALSRAKSLEYLSILDFDVSAIKANRDVIDFYEKIEYGNKKNRLNF